MLIRFNVGNFLSFKTIQEFSMISGKARKKEEHLIRDKNLKLLRFAAIYGANASGKSNFVRAIEFARKTILFNNAIKKFNNSCFKLDETYKNEKSYFEFEFMIEDKYFSYGFEIILNKREFVSEWLLELLPNESKKVLFERDIVNGLITTSLEVKDENLNNQFNVYTDAIRSEKKVLFLNEINRNKKHLYKEQSELIVFEKVYNWFKLTLEINHPENQLIDFSYFENTKKELILDTIKSFGTGITDFKIVELTLDEIQDRVPRKFLEQIESDILDSKDNLEDDDLITLTLRSSNDYFIIVLEKDKEIKVTSIEFEHSNNTFFSLSEESDGTKRIIELIQILLSEQNKIYIIDELDRSLHPQLTYKFVENMLKLTKNKNIQLIITTHESRLLDFDLLRQDEIWMMNKTIDGQSQLYSLDEYNVRFDKKIDKAYLEGRYGGVPIFTTVFPIKED